MERGILPVAKDNMCVQKQNIRGRADSEDGTHSRIQSFVPPLVVQLSASVWAGVSGWVGISDFPVIQFSQSLTSRASQQLPQHSSRVVMNIADRGRLQCAMLYPMKAGVLDLRCN